MALSYFSYYAIGLILSLYLRRFFSPIFFIVVLFHHIFWFLIWGRGSLSKIEFALWMPLTAMFGVLIGYWLAELLNTRRLLFIKHVHRYSWWFTQALLELILLFAILAFWEVTAVFTRPWNFIATFLAYFFIIPLLYFANRRSNIWDYIGTDGQAHRDDYAAEVFHFYFYLFLMGTVLVFGIVEWVDSDSDFWQFWIALIVFGAHLLSLSLLACIAVNWRCRRIYRCRETGAYFSQVASVSEECETTTATTTATCRKPKTSGGRTGASAYLPELNDD